MENNFDLNQTRRLRAYHQHLLPGSWAADATGAVQGACGVQGQDFPGIPLAVRARAQGITLEDVRQAREEQRSLVRTWAMRSTLHLVAANDLPWMLPLFGPQFIRTSQRRYRELGLDEDTFSRSFRVIRRALEQDGPLARAEIARHLGAEGLPFEGQAVPHLLSRAALEGWLCFGPERRSTTGRAVEPTYVLLDDWVRIGPWLGREEALARMARRYLQAFAPASEADLAKWSGMPRPDCRFGLQAIAGELKAVQVAGQPAWMLKDSPALQAVEIVDETVRLLPGFDLYLLGHTDRDWVLEAAYERRIHPGGGLIRPVVLHNGRGVGTWKVSRKGLRVEVVVELFEEIGKAGQERLEEEVAEVRRFMEGA